MNLSRLPFSQSMHIYEHSFSWLRPLLNDFNIFFCSRSTKRYMNFLWIFSGVSSWIFFGFLWRSQPADGTGMNFLFYSWALCSFLKSWRESFGAYADWFITFQMCRLSSISVRISFVLSSKFLLPCNFFITFNFFLSIPRDEDVALDIRELKFIWLSVDFMTMTSSAGAFLNYFRA